MGLVIVFAFVGAVAAAAIASAKRRSGILWGAVGLLFPLIGVIVIACMPALPEPSDAAPGRLP
jgi:hypothetical protein